MKVGVGSATSKSPPVEVAVSSDSTVCSSVTGSLNTGSLLVSYLVAHCYGIWAYTKVYLTDE